VAPLRLGGLRGKQSTPSDWLGGTGVVSMVELFVLCDLVAIWTSIFKVTSFSLHYLNLESCIITIKSCAIKNLVLYSSCLVCMRI
jgi:hypothetical protein